MLNENQNQTPEGPIYGPHLPSPAEYAAVHDRAVEAEEKAVQQETRADIAQAEAATDPDTGLPNKRAFQNMLSGEVKAAQEDAIEAEQNGEEYESTLACLVLDVTDFKNANTELLHQGADEFLRNMADWLQSVFRRQNDIVGVAGRVGGDEFSVVFHLMPRELHVDGDQRTQQARLDDFMQYFEEEKNKFFASQPEAVNRLYRTGGLNLAVGVSLWEKGKAAETLFNEADAKAYQQKELQHQEADRRKQEARVKRLESLPPKQRELLVRQEEERRQLYERQRAELETGGLQDFIDEL